MSINSSTKIEKYKKILRIVSNLLKGMAWRGNRIVWRRIYCVKLKLLRNEDEFRCNMAEMLTYRCCFNIIKNKERQVNDMKSIIGDNGNNCHSHLCFWYSNCAM